MFQMFTDIFLEIMIEAAETSDVKHNQNNYNLIITHAVEFVTMPNLLIINHIFFVTM